MIFEGNPGFVFHDVVLKPAKPVQQFIEQPSREKNMKLHAIRYCNPTTDNHLIPELASIPFRPLISSVVQS